MLRRDALPQRLYKPFGANGHGLNGAARQSLQSAKAAGLRYVSDAAPGITRVASKKRFLYHDAAGRRITDEKTLARIRSLAIPPAYRDVWICPDPNGHIQAVGRDARGRKQYRYHPRWREVRDEHKYGRLIAFAKQLPRIRSRTRADLAKPGMPREKVLAAAIRIMEKTSMRVGNEEYARENRSYGLTTLRNRHAKVRADRVRFEFRGKSGKVHSIELSNPQLAKVVRNCQELPGEELFEYVDDEGKVRKVDSADVNEYLREIAGAPFTAKDFRTWAGTLFALRELQELARLDEKPSKRAVASAVERVAERLGNTKAVCRRCYIHPDVIAAYLEGELPESVQRRRSEEAALLALLEQRLAKAKQPLARKLRASIRKAREERAAARP